jgi:hypothetical protein
LCFVCLVLSRALWLNICISIKSYSLITLILGLNSFLLCSCKLDFSMYGCVWNWACSYYFCTKLTSLNNVLFVINCLC